MSRLSAAWPIFALRHSARHWVFPKNSNCSAHYRLWKHRKPPQEFKHFKIYKSLESGKKSWFFELYFHFSLFLDTRFWSSWKWIKLVPSKKRDWKIRRNLWLIWKYVYDSPNCEVDSFSFPSDWLLRNYHEKRRLLRDFFRARCRKLSNELLSGFDTRQKIR